MKIALCLSGQVRNAIQHTYPFLKDNLLDLNDVDVFLHTWSGHENINASFYNSKAHFKIEDYAYSLDTLKPKKFLIECNDLKLIPKDFDTQKIKHIKNRTCQYISMSKCFDLKKQYERENDLVYDFCIRSRYDFALNKKIDFSKLNKNKFYCIDLSTHEDRSANIFASFNDQFWFTSSDNCDKIKELPFIHEDIINRYNLPDKIGGEGPLYCLVKHDLNVEMERIDYTHPFPPNLNKGMACSHSIVRI